MMRWSALAVALLIGHMSSALAQPVGFVQKGPAEIGFNFDGLWIDRDRDGGEGRYGYREWIRLQLVGEALDRRLLNYQITLHPALAQRSSAGLTETVESRQFGFDAGVDLLSAKPVSFSFAALRSVGRTSGAFGTLSDFEVDQLNARVRVRNPYLPFSVRAGQRSRSNSWRPAAQQSVFRISEAMNTLQLTARNAKTGLTLEYTDFEDRERGNDFIAKRASFDHALRWGKRSQLSSTFDYLDRTGSFPYERRQWQERLRLQHTWDLVTDYSFRLTDLESSGLDARSRSGSWSAGYRLSSFMTIGSSAFAQSTDFDNGRQSSYGAAPSLNFFFGLPGQSRLSTGVSLGWERNRRESTVDQFIVVNEEHVVDESGSFILDHVFVDPKSVVITDANEVVLYDPDFDYRLLATESLVEVLVVVGGRIAIGDTVFVDYSYDVLPNERFDAVFGSYNVNLDLGSRVDVYHRRTLRDNRVVEGPGLGVTDFDDNTTGIRWTQRAFGGLLELDGERRGRRTGDFDYTTYRLQTGLSLPLRPKLSGTVRAAGTTTDAEDKRIDVISSNITLIWTPVPSFRMRGRTSTWFWQQEDAGSEKLLGGGLDVEWRVGLVEATVVFDLIRRNIQSDQTESRLTFNLVRWI
ncbi:MAG: hypothetical protein OEN01_01205 [Candidatus Krumholzibacteria bacterium]|nr:hypothetical protein [Candidatus Krumholzibacteria bacterium]